MRKVVTGSQVAQLRNPDPFAVPAWRSPVYRILDCSCGFGATTCAAAQAAAPDRVLGVDLSEPMLARRRASAARAVHREQEADHQHRDGRSGTGHGGHSNDV